MTDMIPDEDARRDAQQLAWGFAYEAWIAAQPLVIRQAVYLPYVQWSNQQLIDRFGAVPHPTAANHVIFDPPRVVPPMFELTDRQYEIRQTIENYLNVKIERDLRTITTNLQHVYGDPNELEIFACSIIESMNEVIDPDVDVDDVLDRATDVMLVLQQIGGEP